MVKHERSLDERGNRRGPPESLCSRLSRMNAEEEEVEAQVVLLKSHGGHVVEAVAIVRVELHQHVSQRLYYSS